MEIKIYPILSFFNIAYFENVFLNQCIHPFLVNGQNVCEVVLRYLQRLNALLCSSIYKDLTCFYQDARWSRIGVGRCRNSPFQIRLCVINSRIILL